MSDRNLPAATGLELGANNGGLSLFFAATFGSRMVCSDIVSATDLAKTRHQKHGVSSLIEYAVVDAAAISFPDNTFDFVAFKSVLGVVGAQNQPEKIRNAMFEIHRVLKPGGVLFFAENLAGNWLHRFMRRNFVPWGKKWHYPTVQELESYLSAFKKKRIHTTGFLAAFLSKPPWLNNLFARMDPFFRFIPARWHYVGYGLAEK